MTLGVEKALVALNEVQYVSNLIAMHKHVPEDDGGTEDDSEKESGELPVYLLDLYQSAV
jgi:hypothetical protein